MAPPPPRREPSPLLLEATLILRNAAPVGATYLTSYMSNILSAAIVGHLGARAIGAAALATTYANASGYAVLYGTASAIDTLSSQAVGAGNLRRVGLVRQRGLLVLMALALPIGVAWMSCGAVLRACGQDPELAVMAQRYIQILVLGMPAVMAYEAYKKSLQAIGDFTPPLVIGLLATLCNAGVGSALVHASPLGLLGAAAANALSQWLLLLSVLGYYRHHRALRAGSAWLAQAGGCARAPRGARVASEAARDAGDGADTDDEDSDDDTPAIAVVVASASAASSGGGGRVADVGGAATRRAGDLASTPEEGGGGGGGRGRDHDQEDDAEGAALLATPTTAAAAEAAPKLAHRAGDGGSSPERARGDGGAAAPGGGGGVGGAGAAPPATELHPSPSTAAATAAAGAAASPPPPSAPPPQPVAPAPAVAIADLAIDDVLDAIAVPWDRTEALSGWREFLALGVPSAAQLVAEWSSYEVATIIAGVHGLDTLAAHNVLSTSAGLLFMVGLGVSVSGSIRVGKRLGENKPLEARLAYRAVTLCTVAVMAFNAGVTLAARPVWARVFTDDAAVVGLVTRWLPLLALYSMFDAGQCIASGTLKGVGRPALAAVSNVVAYCVISLPLCHYLCNGPPHWGLPGVWAGFVVGVATSCVFLNTILHVLDWRREAEVAHNRALQGAAGAPGAGGH